MPKLFLTKVWGFPPNDYPVLGFTPGGGLEKFLRQGTPEDWVVLAGTKGDETDEDDRGRLLGKVRLGRNLVDVVDVLRSLDTDIPANHWRSSGEYRWPTGLPMLEAHKYVDRPDVAEVFGNYIPGQEWAAFALRLDEKFPHAIIERVRALPSEPVDVVRSPIIAGQVAVHDLLRSNRTGPTGPGPTEHRASVDMEGSPAFAYLLRLRAREWARGGTPVFKVGWAVDPERRIRDLNCGLLPQLTGFSWTPAMTSQRFKTRDDAFRFEQALHARLRRHLVDGETEVYRIRQGDIETEWMTVLSSGTWAVADGDQDPHPPGERSP